MKKSFSTELAYVLGLVILAVGTSFMERAGFGMSMVVAPAYLIYFKISSVWTWFTFGMAESSFQVLLIITLSLVLRTFKLKFLFSIVTALIYSVFLDLTMKLVALIPGSDLISRIIFFIIGLPVCSLGVSMFFHTYISPAAYELFVKELSERHGWNINRVKTIYDCTSCLVAIIMSFVFYGWLHFEGVSAGTVVCALLNGFLIGRFSNFFERRFEFKDIFPLRKYFA